MYSQKVAKDHTGWEIGLDDRRLIKWFPWYRVGLVSTCWWTLNGVRCLKTTHQIGPFAVKIIFRDDANYASCNCNPFREPVEAERGL